MAALALLIDAADTAAKHLEDFIRAQQFFEDWLGSSQGNQWASCGDLDLDEREVAGVSARPRSGPSSRPR